MSSRHTHVDVWHANPVVRWHAARVQIEATIVVRSPEYHAIISISMHGILRITSPRGMVTTDEDRGREIRMAAILLHMLLVSGERKFILDAPY